jgi:hypothetical protein
MEDTLLELLELLDGTVLQPLGCWGCAFPSFCSCILEKEQDGEKDGVQQDMSGH